MHGSAILLSLHIHQPSIAPHCHPLALKHVLEDGQPVSVYQKAQKSPWPWMLALLVWQPDVGVYVRLQLPSQSQFLRQFFRYQIAQGPIIISA